MENQQLSPTATTKESVPLPRAFVWQIGIVVCILSGGLGAFAGSLIAGLYQFLQPRMHSLDVAGIASGSVFGVLAGWLWVRRWVGVPKPLTLGRAAAWGAELGIMASLLTHLIVGPAKSMLDGRPVHWAGILVAAGMFGLPLGIACGAIMGLFCGSLVSSLKPRPRQWRKV